MLQIAAGQPNHAASVRELRCFGRRVARRHAGRGGQATSAAHRKPMCVVALSATEATAPTAVAVAVLRRAEVRAALERLTDRRISLIKRWAAASSGGVGPVVSVNSVVVHSHTLPIMSINP